MLVIFLVVQHLVDHDAGAQHGDVVFAIDNSGLVKPASNGETVDIKPRHGKGEPPLRFNWDSPVIISPHSASTADSENEKLTRLFCANLKRYLADTRGD